MSKKFEKWEEFEEKLNLTPEQEIEIKVFSCPSYKNSIIGISYDNRVIYDYDLMIEDLMKEEDLSYEDALDFLEYNTLRSLPYMGNDAPIILDTKQW